ncbi:sugar phosphate nucleotidyltransferase [Halobacterium salinarum]|uniref:phosphocholine cytidylyltransferase family protein n=1 Tax=Halobacterium salinarum TaxID=2242 RepID=UPI002554F231|nr:sugar phosphate nucleotidyltransferase [Halobacterium salinarum]MDL0133455.1 NTP transferase domain-containing protein [Halobacterium salinarum]
MKQIILAAGKGTRLRPLTADDPKPLVTVSDGESIFDMNVDASERVGLIREAIVVVGYEADCFRSAVRARSGDVPISLVENARYDSTGPVYSLSRGIEAAGDGDFLVQNGDTIYGPDALRAVTDYDADGIRLAVSPAEEFSPDDMNLTVRDGRLEEVGKTVSGEPVAKSAGLVAVRGAASREAFDDAVETLLQSESRVYWHDVLNELTARGIAVETVEVEADSWSEIDTVEDLERARTIHG